MATIQIAERPASIDGCMQTWAEHDEAQVMRSSMDTGTIKVRRRFTGVVWLVDATVTLDAELYPDFRDWFRINCQSGVLPTRVKTPQGIEVVMRMREPPVIDWSIDPAPIAFRATVLLEQLPEWAGL